MRRRGNKSSKVPNVKLRPAEKGSYSRPIVESCWAQETQPGSDDTGVFDLCPRPLKGVAICATGVPDKPTLFKQAVELGATCTPAFTDRVTHLVAVDHGGAKYMCALERKIPIVKPSWITENYQIWLRGDDVDVVKSVERHRLPIFSGVIVCPSGITDITRRTQISKLVTAHDGHYLKNLERPVKVTHLLCSGDEETDKMRYAEKFNGRGEAKIHLVWEEWFWDSLDFGGRFDEATYQVRRPRPERKTLPEAASSPPPPSSDIPSEHDEIPSSSVANPRRPQTNDDDLEEEPAFTNVLPKVTLQLWSTLLDKRGYQVSDGEVILSPSKNGADNAANQPESKQVAESPAGMKFGTARSVLSSFRRADSFAPAVETKNMPGPSRQLPFRRTSTSIAAFGDNKAGPSRLAGESSLREDYPGDEISRSSRSSPAVQIFVGMTLRILGEMKSPNVRNAILQLGGTISSDEDENVDFIVVRLVSGSKFYRDEEDETVRAKYRTECWLEQCIYDERLCSPDEQVTFSPLVVQTPVPGAESVVLAISGFSQSEKYGLKRLFRALGIALAPVFTRRSTHLLCPSGTGQKFDKAHEWDIPVVGLQWLSAVTTSGLIPPVDDFIISGLLNEKDNGRKDLKGKGKAADKGNERAAPYPYQMDIDPDNRMNDITNSDNPQPPSNLLPNVSPTRKPKTVERQATTIIPNQGPLETIMFGIANHTLAGSFTIHPSSIASRTRSLIAPATPKGESSRLGSFSSRSSTKGSLIIDTNSDNNSAGPSSSSLRQQLQQRQPTIPHLETNEHDRRLGRVPSSTSPSPMKVPRTGSRLSLSPVKIDHEVTKALQESITTLLGKRPSPDADADEPGGARVGGTTGVVEVTGADMPQRKKGKRARPQRTKPQSRQPSSARIAESETLPRSKSNQAIAAGFGGAPDTLNPFESYTDDLQAGKSQQEESMRVMYEDPGQQEEKKRLMRLLKGQAGDEESMGTSLTLSLSGPERRTRRSTRIAGF